MAAEARDGRNDGTEIQAVVRLATLSLRPFFSHGQRFGSAGGEVAPRLGLTKLGATYLEVPPGKSAFPRHVHHVNDEMLVIFAGAGEYRLGGETHQVGPGDVLGAPRGGPELAHQLTNIGTEPLKYLAIASVSEAEVCEYPDSGKFAVGSELPKGEFSFTGRVSDARDYWEGEAG